MAKYYVTDAAVIRARPKTVYRAIVDEMDVFAPFLPVARSHRKVMKAGFMGLEEYLERDDRA